MRRRGSALLALAFGACSSPSGGGGTGGVGTGGSLATGGSPDQPGGVGASGSGGGITQADTVNYNTSVQTADGNVNGSIRFGSDRSYMTLPTAMHEIAHTVGMGSAPFDALVANGIFTGPNATTQLRAITGVATDQMNADTQHFWPYGLNYDSEYHDLDDAIDHREMVTAIRKDMGMN